MGAFRQYQGVYSVGTPDLDRFGRWLGAVLACGDTAVLSHRSAAAVWGLMRPVAGAVDVTVPGRSTRRRVGIRVHATRSLPAAEVRRPRGIPCTTVERTLIDIAGAPAAAVERAVRQAFALRLLGRTRMAEARAQTAGRESGISAV
jgi:hypothetical protein